MHLCGSEVRQNETVREPVPVPHPGETVEAKAGEEAGQQGRVGRHTAILTNQGHVSELAGVSVQPEGIKQIA